LADAGRAADAKEVSGGTGGAVATQAIGAEGAAAVNVAVVDGESDCGDAVKVVGVADAVDLSGAEGAACSNAGSGRAWTGENAGPFHAFDEAGVEEAGCAEETVGATEVAGAKMARTKEVKAANGVTGAGDAAGEGGDSGAFVAVAIEASGAVELADANGMVIAKDKESW
jgi:hypothetical protein